MARLPEDYLGRFDIALVQFAANVGLPGSDRLDPWGCARRLDAMAARVRDFTAARLGQFRRGPADFENSEGYFRALCLATVLQTEFGVRYDPAKVPRDVPFGVADTTVHGILLGDGGTCASLAVLYAAVGRRLGYPIKLVSGYVDRGVTHLFARWDGGSDRFNIEATGTGLATPPDDHYRTGRYRMTPECERLGRFLVPESPRMELAGFLRDRAGHCGRAGDRGGRAEALAWAVALDPGNVLAEDQLRQSLNDWTGWAEGLLPPGFPAVAVGGPQGRRLFPDALGWGYEHQILWLGAVERLLSDPDLGRVWEGMRRGEWAGRGPSRVRVEYRTDGTSVAEVSFGG